MTARYWQRLIVRVVLVCFLATLVPLPPVAQADDLGLPPDVAYQMVIELQQRQQRTKMIEALGAGDDSAFGEQAKNRIMAFIRQLDEDNYWAMQQVEKAIYWRQRNFQGLVRKLAQIELGESAYVPTPKAATYVMDLTTYALVGDGAKDYATRFQATKRFWQTFFNQAGACLGGNNPNFKGSFPYQYQDTFSNPDSKRSFMDSCPDLHDTLYQLGFPKDNTGIFDMPPIFTKSNKFRVKWTADEITKLKGALRLAYPDPSKASLLARNKKVAQETMEAISFVAGFAFIKLQGDPKTGEVDAGPDWLGIVISAATLGIADLLGGSLGTALGNWQTREAVRRGMRTGGNISGDLSLGNFFKGDLIPGGQFDAQILAAQKKILSEGFAVPRTPKFGSSKAKYARQGELAAANGGVFQAARLKFVETEWERMFVKGELGTHGWNAEIAANPPTATDYQNALSGFIAYLAGERKPANFEAILGRENGTPIPIEQFDWLMQQIGGKVPSRKTIEEYRRFLFESKSNTDYRLIQAFDDLLVTAREQPSEFLIDVKNRIKERAQADPKLAATLASLGGKTAIEYVDGFVPWLLRRDPVLHEFEFDIYFSAFGTNRQLQRGVDLKLTSDVDVVLYYHPELMQDPVIQQIFRNRQALLDESARREAALNAIRDAENQVFTAAEAAQEYRQDSDNTKFQQYLRGVWETYMHDPKPDGGARLGIAGNIDRVGRHVELAFDNQFDIPEALRVMKSKPEKDWNKFGNGGLLWVYGAGDNNPFTYSVSQGVVDRFGRVPRQIVEEMPWMAKAIENANRDLHDNVLRAVVDKGGSREPTLKDALYSSGTTIDYFKLRTSTTGVFRGFREILDGMQVADSTQKLFDGFWRGSYQSLQVTNAQKAYGWYYGMFHEQTYLIPKLDQAGRLADIEIVPKRLWKMDQEASQPAQALSSQLANKYMVTLDGFDHPLSWQEVTQKGIWDDYFQEQTGFSLMDYLRQDKKKYPQIQNEIWRILEQNRTTTSGPGSLFGVSQFNVTQDLALRLNREFGFNLITHQAGPPSVPEGPIDPHFPKVPEQENINND